MEFTEYFAAQDAYLKNNYQNDDKIILAGIAKENATRSWANEKQWFCLYTLQHRCQYMNEVAENKSINSYCVISNGAADTKSTFDNRMKEWQSENGVFVQKDLDDLLKEHIFPKWLKDENGIIYPDSTYTFDNDGNSLTMYSDESCFGEHNFSANARTMAALNGSFISNPIIYEGYNCVLAGSRSANVNGTSFNYGSCSLSGDQSSIYTLGGAPLSATNWVMCYVEYGISSTESIGKGSDQGEQYCYSKNDTSTRFVLCMYIHFFFPDGSYVRTILDRTNEKTFKEGFQDYPFYYWSYEDYANRIASQTGKNFSSIWNDIQERRYRRIGDVRDQNGLKINLDMLRNWDTGGQKDTVQHRAASYSLVKECIENQTYNIDIFKNGWGGGKR